MFDFIKGLIEKDKPQPLVTIQMVLEAIASRKTKFELNSKFFKLGKQKINKLKKAK
jgi:hypothetical protein